MTLADGVNLAPLDLAAPVAAAGLVVALAALFVPTSATSATGVRFRLRPLVKPGLFQHHPLAHGQRGWPTVAPIGGLDVFGGAWGDQVDVPAALAVEAAHDLLAVDLGREVVVVAAVAGIDRPGGGRQQLFAHCHGRFAVSVHDAQEHLLALYQHAARPQQPVLRRAGFPLPQHGRRRVLEPGEPETVPGHLVLPWYRQLLQVGYA